MIDGLLDTSVLVDAETLRKHAIPEDATTALSGNRVFVWRPPGAPS
jgi:hypothetical protein